jgi:hypothetical protein
MGEHAPFLTERLVGCVLVLLSGTTFIIPRPSGG